jgi:solute carrier family 35 protein F5
LELLQQGELFDETIDVGLLIVACPSFTGVVLVSLSDSTSQLEGDPATPITDTSIASSGHLDFTNAVFGDGLALLSAVFYALYVILLKVKIKEENRIDMQLFFGFVGVFNMLMLWPFGLVLHLTGAEKMEFPHTGKAWTAVLVNVSIIDILCCIS